jgi:hypothetical protein
LYAKASYLTTTKGAQHKNTIKPYDYATILHAFSKDEARDTLERPWRDPLDDFTKQ